MGLGGWLKKLEHAAREDLASFELDDGSHFYFDADEAYKALFLHWSECIYAGSAHNWPEPPELLRKITEAKDPEGALGTLGVVNQGAGFLVYDPEVIITERRLEPRGLVTCRDPATGEWHVRDPYDQEVEDFSE